MYEEHHTSCCKEPQHHLGTAKDFGMIEVPLTCQTTLLYSSPLPAATGNKNKGSPLIMDSKQMQAFAKIKQMLVTPPVLAVESLMKSERMFQVSVLEQCCCTVITRRTRESLPMNLKPLRLKDLMF